MDEMPREVEAAVRAAARTTGGYAGRLDDVYRRARRRRHRQSAAAFAGVAALLVGVGLGVTMQSSPSGRVAQTAASATADAPAPGAAQRLLLTGAAGSYRSAASPATKLGGGDQIGELLPDGRIVRHDVVGADGWDRWAGLPDGRIVALGPHDTMPGADREDGVDVPGLEIRLVVAGADGAVQVERDVRRMGEGVALLTAAGSTAYLWRPGGLVAHDLASGSERLLVGREALELTGVFDGSVEAADLTGDRLVLSRATDPCDPRILDTSSGRVLAELSLSAVRCRWVSGLRLSPDGAAVAVTYQTPDVAAGFRVALLRTADGAVLADRGVAGTRRTAATKRSDQVLVDVAWLDARTLRGVAVPVAAGTHELKHFTINTY